MNMLIEYEYAHRIDNDPSAYSIMDECALPRPDRALHVERRPLEFGGVGYGAQGQGHTLAGYCRGPN